MNRERILEIAKKDSDFFRDNNIIDYSMLIGVTNRSEHPHIFSNSFDANDNDVKISNGNETPLGTLNMWDGEMSSL